MRDDLVGLEQGFGRDGEDAEDRLIPPDPGAPDYHAQRFLACAYRTTRALLAAKGLIVRGQSINEAEFAMPGIFTSTAPILAQDSPFFDEDLAVLPTENHAPEERQRISTMHGYTALQIGYDPEDPCLHWFEAEHFELQPEAVLLFEIDLLETVGKTMQHRGRLPAFRHAQELLGPIESLERQDFLALPYAWVREMKSAATEDDRMLQALRLEDLIHRCRDALDIRAELAANRQLAAILGLTFQDQERGNRELIALMQQPRKLRLTE